MPKSSPLGKREVTAPTKPERAPQIRRFESLSRAGSLIRSGQLDFAADKLNNAFPKTWENPKLALSWD